MKGIRFRIRFLLAAMVVVAVLLTLWQQHRQLSRAEAALARHWYALDTVLPIEHYRVLKHDVLESDTLHIQHLFVETLGEQTVRLEGAGETAVVPSHGTRYDYGIHRVEIMLIANHVEFGKVSRLTVTATMKSGDRNSVTTWTSEVADAQRMRDVLSLGKASGVHSVGDRVALFLLNDEPVAITIR